MEAQLEQLFLYNHEAEVNVLGAILLEPDLIKDCPNKPEEFSPGKHHKLFATMKDLDNKGIPIDPVAIAERVGKRIGELGGISYITELVGAIPTTANFTYHCGVIKDYYQKRQTLNIAEKIKADVLNESPREAINNALSSLMAVEDNGTDDDDGDIDEALIAMYNDIENATGEVTGVPTGYRDLDRMTGGYKEEQFIIVAARPGVGKTAFVINKMLNMAENGDIGALFSLEMAKKELLKRASSTVGHIDAQRMKRARLDFDGSDWRKLTMSMGKLGEYRKAGTFKIFDKPGVDVNYIWSKARKLRRANPDKRITIFIDYLQLIRGSEKHKGNRTQEISEISRMLKEMARDLKITVVALSQLSRAVEQRQDKRPMLSDLRESGQLEQDADIIQFLYREDYYDKETENKNTVEVIIAKHRDGPVGNVTLAFVKEYGKFVNIDWGAKS